MVIKEEDTASDKAQKVLGRLILGIGTLGLSEEAIENHEKDYKDEKEYGALLRENFLVVFESFDEIGKAEKELFFMIKDKNEERVKYRIVMMNNFLNNASEKLKRIRNPGQGQIGDKFRKMVEDIIEKKKQVIEYWIKNERGAAAAYQTLANQKILGVIDDILKLNASNQYVFSQEEIYKIVAVREEWAKSIGVKTLPGPEQKHIF